MASDNTIVVGFETEGVQMTMEALKALRSQSEKMEKAETQAYIEQSKRNAKALDELRKMQAEHRANLDASIKYSTGFAGGLNKIADDIKRVGKDLDNVSGKGAKDFAMMTEGALSVVAAIGTGGVAGAIGLATLAIGTIVGKWQESQQAAEEAAKKASDAAKAHADLVKEISAGIRAGQKQLDMEGVLQKEAELQARRLLLAQRGNELVEASLKIQKAIENHSASELLEARQAYNAKRLELQKEQSDILLEEKKVSDRKDRLLQRDINEGILDMQKEALAKQKKVQLEKHEDTFEEIAKLRDFANKKAEAEAKLHRERMAAIMFDDEYDKDLPLPPGIGLRPEEIKAQKERDDMLRKAGEDAERESERRADKLEREAAALKKKQEAEEQANNALIAHTASTIAYESAAMFVQPAISGLTNKIGELRDVNRENFQDFFDFSKMTPELVAAQVQAIAVGIAQQALGKAAMSGADAVKETALAIGDFAYGNAAGGTAHLKSAALHASAAAAYGAIAGGAAGVAVGIGATRGATAEEKERSERRKGSADGTGSMSSGSTMGRGDGSGGGGFSVTVVNNAPLIVPPSDQNRAGRAVARAVSRANRDAFARREMGQR